MRPYKRATISPRSRYKWEFEDISRLSWRGTCWAEGGYAWFRDDWTRSQDEPVTYLQGAGWGALLTGRLSWNRSWSLMLGYRLFRPEVQLNETIQQLLSTQGSLYDIFTIPNQSFILDDLQLSIGYWLGGGKPARRQP